MLTIYVFARAILRREHAAGEAGSEPERRGPPHGRTALHLSAELGFPEFVDMLIVRGANMYASGEKRWHHRTLPPIDVDRNVLQYVCM